MKLWKRVGLECLVLLIIYASCEKKIDPKHPGEANPCCLCDQLRHKLYVRNEWKYIVEKSCTDPSQARRCRAGEGCQREEHSVLWSPVMETRMWEKILQQKVVKSSQEGEESSSVSWRQRFRSNSSLWKCSKTTQTTSSWVKDELQYLGLDGRSKEEHWGTSVDAEAVLELWDGPVVSKVRVYIFS